MSLYNNYQSMQKPDNSIDFFSDNNYKKTFRYDCK